jgi:hypothetical protein
MSRLFIWGTWILALVFMADLTFISIPHRLTEERKQMQITSLQTAGKTGTTWVYAIGKIEGRDKPVHMTVSSLLRKKTIEYGESLEVFKSRYLGTGELINVTVGTSLFTSYDVAYADFEGRSQNRYSTTTLIVTDILLLLLLVGLYLYLRSTAPPLPPEPSDFQQPGGF